MPVLTVILNCHQKETIHYLINITQFNAFTPLSRFPKIKPATGLRFPWLPALTAKSDRPESKPSKIEIKKHKFCRVAIGPTVQYFKSTVTSNTRENSARRYVAFRFNYQTIRNSTRRTGKTPPQSLTKKSAWLITTRPAKLYETIRTKYETDQTNPYDMVRGCCFSITNRWRIFPGYFFDMVWLPTRFYETDSTRPTPYQTKLSRSILPDG